MRLSTKSLTILHLDSMPSEFEKKNIYIYIYLYTEVKELKRTHRFSVTLSFAPKCSSDRTFHRELMRPLSFFDLCILSSATTALSTLCQGRLYPTFIYIPIYKYILKAQTMP